MVIAIKLLLLGDSGVGKTGLIMRYCDNTFPMSFASTIGVDIKIKMINIKGQKVKLQIWDTAGQERFKTLTSNVYRGVHGLMLVYDISDEFSFSNVRKWMMHLDKHTDSKTLRVLIGNKVDSTSRKISFAQGLELANEFGIKFFETSGKDDINVTPSFEYLAADVMESKKLEASSSDMDKKLQLHDGKSGSCGGC